MASSSTYALAPDVADFVSEAFERNGIDPATLTVRHTRSARMSMNLLFSDWGNRGVHLFTMDEQTQLLTEEDPTYTVATGTLAIIEGFIRRVGVDTTVRNISMEAYAAIPSKTQQGLPTSVYLDRRTGIYTLWETPENSTDVFHYFRLRRLQDVSTAQETPDLPYLWFESLASGLAAKLAVKFAPDRVALLKGEAEEAFRRAITEDRERTDTSFTVSM